MGTIIRKYKLFQVYLDLQEEHPLAAHYSKEYLKKFMPQPRPINPRSIFTTQGLRNSSPNGSDSSTLRRLFGEWKE